MEHDTFTYRIAALQMKMLHLQFRMKKIYDDQKAINSQRHNTNREKIRGLRNATYSTIDMLITMEHAATLFQEVFSTPELSKQLTKDDREILSRAKTIASKWQKVRNKLGGHIDLKMVEAACEHHNFKGVFLIEDLETDVSILNVILLESALNTSGYAEKEFGRKIDTRKNLQAEIELITNKLNGDWEAVFSYFNPLMKRLYDAGKKDKIANTHPNDRKGLVVGD